LSTPTEADETGHFGRYQYISKLTPESQQLIKGAMEKKGIFLAVSLANESDWICTK